MEDWILFCLTPLHLTLAAGLIILDCVFSITADDHDEVRSNYHNDVALYKSHGGWNH